MMGLLQNTVVTSPTLSDTNNIGDTKHDKAARCYMRFVQRTNTVVSFLLARSPIENECLGSRNRGDMRVLDWNLECCAALLGQLI